MSPRLGLQGGQGGESGYMLRCQHQQFFVSSLGFGGSIAAPEQFAAVVEGIYKIGLQIQCCFKGGNGPVKICRGSQRFTELVAIERLFWFQLNGALIMEYRLGVAVFGAKSIPQDKAKRTIERIESHSPLQEGDSQPVLT